MKIKVLFICHGNICRSPMAEYIFKDMIEKRGLKDMFYVESRATSTEEIWGKVGNPLYPPARNELIKRGIGKTVYTDFTCKRAEQVKRHEYSEYDYILCADSMNIRNTIRITGPDTEDKIKLLLDFSETPQRHGDSISDPWYTGDFEKTYDDIVEGLEGFMDYILNTKQYRLESSR